MGSQVADHVYHQEADSIQEASNFIQTGWPFGDSANNNSSILHSNRPARLEGLTRRFHLLQLAGQQRPGSAQPSFHWRGRHYFSWQDSSVQAQHNLPSTVTPKKFSPLGRTTWHSGVLQRLDLLATLSTHTVPIAQARDSG